ncbi:MAG TPA: hemerythrin domain-containing protein [Blastocatellia bacterium]|nr:hemerythrin domain-containing protein [Blastocatellia bacterium]
MSAEQFTQIFRDEHRKVRDVLFDLIQAFDRRDPQRIGALLGEAASYAGPHFRYEEESLYPALVEVFGRQYIEKLLHDHDRVIGTAARLVELSGKQALSVDDVAEATELVRSILPHVSDCDGLSIMVERLPAATVQDILATRERAWSENLELFTWTSGVRTRPAVSAEQIAREYVATTASTSAQAR